MHRHVRAILSGEELGGGEWGEEEGASRRTGSVGFFLFSLPLATSACSTRDTPACAQLNLRTKKSKDLFGDARRVGPHRLKRKRGSEITAAEKPWRRASLSFCLRFCWRIYHHVIFLARMNAFAVEASEGVAWLRDAMNICYAICQDIFPADEEQPRAISCLPLS